MHVSYAFNYKLNETITTLLNEVSYSVFQVQKKVGVDFQKIK